MLVILATHPIQYQVPIWQELAKVNGQSFEIWYLSQYGSEPSIDPEFGFQFKWDIPLLEGYPFRFLDGFEDRPPSNFLRTNYPNFANEFAQHKVTTVLVLGWHVLAFWQAIIIAKRQGVHVLVRGDSHDINQSTGIKNLVKRLLLSYLFSNVDEFLYVGKANFRLYKSYQIPNHKLKFSPHCIDNDRFLEEASIFRGRRETIRNSWQIPLQAFTFVFCGKFIPIKNLLTLLDAFVLLWNTLPSSYATVHLLLVGEGEQKSMIQNKIRELWGANPPVSVIGFLNQKEISKAYVAGDCLILPSYSETWGLVVNEAYACGIPALVSNKVGCAEDLVTPVNPDFIFDPYSVSALRDSMLNCIEAKPSELSEKCKQIIESYSLQATANIIREFSSNAGRNDKF
jgi:glycosyltransferase involved in cell wall biosynthesis